MSGSRDCTLLDIRGTASLHLLVKDPTGAGSGVLLTPDEIRHARRALLRHDRAERDPDCEHFFQYRSGTTLTQPGFRMRATGFRSQPACT